MRIESAVAAATAVIPHLEHNENEHEHAAAVSVSPLRVVVVVASKQSAQQRIRIKDSHPHQLPTTTQLFLGPGTALHSTAVVLHYNRDNAITRAGTSAIPPRKNPFLLYSEIRFTNSVSVA